MNTSNFMNKIEPNVVQKQTGTFGKVLGWLFVIVLFVIIGIVLVYLLTGCYEKKSFWDYLQDLDPCTTKYKPASLAERKLEDEEEVFHISNQIYTYPQAQKKCKAYGAKLANYNQVMNAYNKGAEWCSYGWSEGQHAYYPTQFCTWEKLQEGSRRWRKSCGNPGVNGGYFNNSNLRFGVNCYGIKPGGKVVKPGPFKKCDQKQFCNREGNYDSCHKLATDEVVPFNTNEWSMYGN